MFNHVAISFAGAFSVPVFSCSYFLCNCQMSRGQTYPISGMFGPESPFDATMYVHRGLMANFVEIVLYFLGGLDSAKAGDNAVCADE